MNLSASLGETTDPVLDRVDMPINGMSCASCARRVEKQLGSLKGVHHAGVNFATSRDTVEYDPKELGVSDLIAEITRTGYEAAGKAKAEFRVHDYARPSGSSQRR